MKEADVGGAGGEVGYAGGEGVDAALGCEADQGDGELMEKGL